MWFPVVCQHLLIDGTGPASPQFQQLNCQKRLDEVDVEVGFWAPGYLLMTSVALETGVPEELVPPNFDLHFLSRLLLVQELPKEFHDQPLQGTLLPLQGTLLPEQGRRGDQG